MADGHYGQKNNKNTLKICQKTIRKKKVTKKKQVTNKKTFTAQNKHLPKINLQTKKIQKT